ncbi:MAG TPA: hypothetical protein VN451_04050 [Chitinophagaceae bacterium]|nr:hypothetical protein [Chitinophagaceae bacterium]
MRLKLTCFAVAYFLLAEIAFSQPVVTVNNTPGETANYRTLQGALDSVADGTIILLQPGPVSYGNATIRKRVSIMGAGYFLGLNPDPFTQANLQSSITGSINFDSLSNGSQVTGIFINGNTPLQFHRTSNITVTRCLVSPDWNSAYSYVYRSSGIYMKQCMFYTQANLTFNPVICIVREATGIEFHNSIFLHGNPAAYSNLLPSEYFTSNTASILFKNNVIINPVNESYYPASNTFINNIIFKLTGGTMPPLQCVGADRNIGNVDYAAGGGVNNNTAVYSDVFLLNTGPVAYGPDGKFKLKAGSPAIGFGQGGVDCGAFGGTGAYVLSGIPFIPNIYLAELNGVPTSGGLKLRLKVKANQ